jgi:ubiquinone biosynthesis protein
MELRSIRNLQRFKEIIAILLRYGFDEVVDRLRLPGGMMLKRIVKVEKELTTPVRIRHMLEGLGPTFVKFGQIASMRPDLIPKTLLHELRELQDHVPPVDFSEIKGVVEGSLKKGIGEVFAAFDPIPVGSASLAQSHKAVLKEEGVPVVVKVQRPHIRRTILSDMDLLTFVAERIHEHMDAYRTYDLPGLVRELRNTLMKELDFSREAQNMRIVSANFSNDPHFHAPAVYEKYSTPTVLTMEYIEGVRVDEIDGSRVDSSQIARWGAQAVFKQIFLDGFFHADPHAGNILIIPDEVICFLDWGMVGILTRTMRYEVGDLFLALIEQDERQVVRSLLKMAASEEISDARVLEKEVLDILNTYQDRNANVGQLLLELMEKLRVCHVRVRTEYTYMSRAILAMEGTGRLLDPSFNIFEEAKPFATGLLIERWKPKNLARILRSGFPGLVELFRELPNRLAHLLEQIEQGRISMTVDHRGLDLLNQTLDNITNRITLGIIIGSLIIGSSMIITTGIKPLLFGYPMIGILGYLFSAVLGMWLVINIIKSKKY